MFADPHLMQVVKSPSCKLVQLHLEIHIPCLVGLILPQLV